MIKIIDIRTPNLMNVEQTKAILTKDLNAIFKDMPSELINQEGYLRLSALTEMFPSEFSNFWGVECRLNTDEPLADILFEIKNNTSSQKLLAGYKPSNLDILCANYNAWHKIRAFANHWAQEQSILNKHILNLWLEFDTERLTSHKFAEDLLQKPSVFLGLRSRELSESECTQILYHANSLLLFPKILLDSLQSFISHIPSPGQLFQLGSMLGRTSRDLRVCVNHLPFDVVPNWLVDIGWKGDSQALSVVLSKLAPILRAFAIDLNLTEQGPSQKIGLECYIDWEEGSSDQWKLFLGTIQQFILCSPAKRIGLLQYPGEVLLPSTSRRTADGALCFSLFKRIHHIKLGFDNGHVTDAKAYLSIHKPGMQTNSDWLIE